MAGRVEGKVAFITGAARGQGRSHAVRLAEEGADIIAVDICAPVDSVTEKYELASPDDLQDTVAAVEKVGRHIVARHADVRNPASLEKALQEGIDELGRLDVVVANAGIASFGQGWELDETTWQDMIDINLTGVWHTAKAAVPRLLEADNGGSIVFTGSIGGLKGVMNVAHYVSAKHGLVGLMRTFANELAPRRIRVNTIHPTNVDTDMIQNPGTYAMFLPAEPHPTQEKAMSAFTGLNAIPVPWVDSVDISNAVLFLASDESRYITGISLPVDAGASIK